MNDAIKTDLQGCACVLGETGDSVGGGIDVSKRFELVFDVSTSLGVKHNKWTCVFTGTDFW